MDDVRAHHHSAAGDLKSVDVVVLQRFGNVAALRIAEYRFIVPDDDDAKRTRPRSVLLPDPHAVRLPAIERSEVPDIVFRGPGHVELLQDREARTDLAKYPLRVRHPPMPNDEQVNRNWTAFKRW